MSDGKLRIGLVQFDIRWENPEENHRRIEAIIGNNPDQAELIVLPEMFATGFSMNPEKVAETINGASVQWLKKIASEQNVAITGSLSIRENDNFYNRMFFVKPSGETDFYDKRHLFTLAGEDKVYTTGTRRKIVEYKGFRINLQVCYDLRFPAFARYDGDYDLLIYVANWPQPRIFAWDTLTDARAIENMAFVAAVNRIGVDPNGNAYPGHSRIIGPLGERLLETGEAEGVFVAEIDLEGLNQTRQRFGFLEDRDRIRVT